jgi:methyl-accepting chemotaxis protein
VTRYSLNVRVAVAVGLAIGAGIAVATLLVVRLQITNRDYAAILSECEVRHQDAARVIQLGFKKQVQEWKNLLLRGGTPEEFTRYENRFRADETTTRSAADALLAEVADPEARTRLASFIDAHATMGKRYAEAIDLLRANGHHVVAADAHVKGQDRAPTDLLDRLATRLDEVVNEREAEQGLVVRRAIGTSVTIAAVAFVAAIGGVTLIVRGLRRELLAMTTRLTRAAEGTAAGASQVATLSQSLSSGATEQAAALEQTSASMSEMVAVTSANGESARDAAGLVYDADLRVGGAKRSLAEMVAAMDGIEESSQQVVQIIKTIDEIAFQTNILALNAAVEAARAGDAGLGFAVVAREVRALAQRSATAAQDTARLIEESIERARDGSRCVVRAEESIGAIAESVQRVKSLVDEVSAATGQQARSYEQVTQAIAQMEAVTQSTAASAEESAAASEELSAQAADVRAETQVLRRLIGADATVGTRSRRSRAVSARDTGSGRAGTAAAA